MFAGVALPVGVTHPFENTNGHVRESNHKVLNGLCYSSLVVRSKILLSIKVLLYKLLTD